MDFRCVEFAEVVERRVLTVFGHSADILLPFRPDPQMAWTSGERGMSIP